MWKRCCVAHRYHLNLPPASTYFFHPQTLHLDSLCNASAPFLSPPPGLVYLFLELGYKYKAEATFMRLPHYLLTNVKRDVGSSTDDVSEWRCFDSGWYQAFIVQRLVGKLHLAFLCCCWIENLRLWATKWVVMTKGSLKQICHGSEHKVCVEWVKG